MEVRVVETTDGKHKGEVYTVPLVNKEVMRGFGMVAESITWTKEDVCVVVNANYTIKLKKIKD